MGSLGTNTWGKSGVRVSKILRGESSDEFVDIDVSVLLSGDVGAAYTDGDNRAVLPTDTTKNTIYGLAQEHLSTDLEHFGTVLCAHFLTRGDIDSASVTIEGRRWERRSSNGFVGGGAERRIAVVAQSSGGPARIEAGLSGLVVLKTGGSAFTGFPRDEFTILPEAEDRLLSTSVTAHWAYTVAPGDATEAWERVRQTIVDRFFSDWSASVQHQGWLIAQAVLEVVPEIASVTFELPNQHHLPVDLARFGLEDRAIVFHPVSEPYGDIRFTVTR